MKIIIYILSFQFLGIALIAQSASEVLKYSLARPFGTARATGCIEAMGALGGDFTAIGINPAGIGLFRKSDFYISTYANFDEQQSTLSNGANSTFSNSTYSKTKDSYGITGLGFVFTSSPIASKWSNVNFAINLMKTANFNKSYYFKGKSVGSITDRFLELALDPNKSGLIGLDPNKLDAFEARLAYETGALFHSDSAKTMYSTDLLRHQGYLLPKEQILKTSGGLYDLSFGLGGNYDETWAFGASIDIPFGSFRSESDYLESEAKKNEVLPFKNLDFQEVLHTSINGIGGKLGIIFKPSQFLRVGLSWQTPTYLWMRDQYHTSLTYSYNDQTQDTSFTSYSPDGEFTYRLTLPMRTVLSAAYIAKHGFVSADIDFLNVSHAKYNLTADSDQAGDYVLQQEVNNDIKKQYKSAIQYRLGGELALGFFRLRAGLEFLQQVYSNSDKYDMGYSFGFGFRRDRFYIDLGYKHTEVEQAYAPYLTGNSDFDGNGTVDAPTPLVNQKSIQQLIQVTFGFKL